MEKVSNKMYVGYFTCPACGHMNTIGDWRMELNNHVDIRLTAGKSDLHDNYQKMVFVCEKCKKEWEFGIKET